MITRGEKNLINVLEREGLEVIREGEHFIIQDSEWHTITIEVVDDMFALIIDNDSRIRTVSINRESQLMTEVLDALDYDLEE